MLTAKKNIHVIINPKSGTSSKQSLPNKINRKLASDFNVEIFFTEYAGHAPILTQNAIDKNIDYVIAVGGDGTVNEVARTLINSGTTLGIIPLGSGNGLARDLHIPINKDKALDIIKAGNSIDIDYGIANQRVFFCTCGMGFDALVSQQAAKSKKRGSLMYFRTMFETFWEQKADQYEIICPEGTLNQEAFVLTCANAGQYGYNAYIAPDANIQDGKMNIVLLKPLSVLDAPVAGLQLMTKTIDRNKKMVQIITQEAIIRRKNNGPMHIDGDYIEAGNEIHVKIMPKGLKVLAPDPDNLSYEPQDILSYITRWI